MNLNEIFYHDKPLFGLDIGHSSIKAMQVDKVGGNTTVISGYSLSSFAPGAVRNGEIIKPEVLAEAIHNLFEKSLVGAINSRRVACALPTSHTFSRPMKLPPMDQHDIVEATQLEASQYIPVPIDSLYLDYEVTSRSQQGLEVLLVATPRKIVDSYMNLLKSLKLEPVVFEPSINAASRLLQMAGKAAAEPSILVDIGSVTTDLAVFDRTLLVSSTINAGGDTITDLIARNLHMSEKQASELKNQYGIAFSEKQQRIVDAIKSQLDNLVREIQKSIRYHSERAAQSGKHITKVITLGGGAMMPGLNHYLAIELRMPCESFDPWQLVSFGNLAPPAEADRSMYITVAGESILDPLEVTHD